MKRKIHNRTYCLLLFMLILLCTGCSNKPAEVKSGESTVPEQALEEIPEEEIEGLSFPIKLDSDKLVLSSVFEYSGINPDCEDVYVESIHAIQLKNVSGEYLKRAEICVTLSDGQVLNFLVEDVPADMEVMAFEIQNLEYDDTLKVTEAVAKTEYSAEESTEEFAYSVNGNEITVENISEAAKNNITLYYHCTIDGLGFGGCSYELTIDSLEAGESTTVSDTFCYLGDVTIVNVND